MMKPYHLILIFSLFISVSSSYASGVTEDDINIFILHSYSQEYPWTRNEHNGFVDMITNAGLGRNIRISVEYLDTKRVSFDSPYSAFFYKYLQQKYSNYSPDLIFCTDDNALNFLIQFKTRLFGNIPVVFCGINDFVLSQNLNDNNFTGVLEKKEILPNLSLIKRIFRTPGELKILGDGSDTCNAIVTQIKEQFPCQVSEEDVEFLLTGNLESLLEELKSIEKGILLLTSIGGLKGKNGMVVPLNTAIRSIINSGEFSIISMEDAYFQAGVLGGYMTSGVSQGREAAKIAVKILSGVKAASIPILDKSPNQYIFDYREIDRLNFPVELLPNKSIIYNKPGSVYTQYKKVIWSFAGAFIVLAAAFVGVVFSLFVTRKAKKAITESEKKYRNLFESSTDAMFILDKKLNFVDSNAAALKLFGFESKDQFLTTTPVNLSTAYQPDGESSFKKAKKMVDTAIKENRLDFEWRHKRLDGQQFDSSVLLSKVKINGQIMLQATVRDLSEQKKAQEMLIQSEKMMSVGGLAAGMAHEINNPLAGVIQSTGVILNRLSSKDIAANRQAAETAGISMDAVSNFMEARNIFGLLGSVKDAGMRMASIVENMLSFARKGDSSFSTHDPADLLDKTLELAGTGYDLKKKYDFKNIVIKKEYENNLPMVACESTKIQQVLFNILTNGAQAMNENPNISRPQFILRLKHEKNTQMLRIEIEDNGPGMDDKTCKKIFEPFFTTKPVGEGTGLGLSVSYFIVTENHKGKMTVSSELGKGTNFIICLPLEQRHE